MNQEMLKTLLTSEKYVLKQRHFKQIGIGTSPEDRLGKIFESKEHDPCESHWEEIDPNLWTYDQFENMLKRLINNRNQCAIAIQSEKASCTIDPLKLREIAGLSGNEQREFVDVIALRMAKAERVILVIPVLRPSKN